MQQRGFWLLGQAGAAVNLRPECRAATRMLNNRLSRGRGVGIRLGDRTSAVALMRTFGEVTLPWQRLGRLTEGNLKTWLSP